jgi:hypothetical protein
MALTKAEYQLNTADLAPALEMIRSAFRCGRSTCDCREGNKLHCPNLSAHKHGDRKPSLIINVKDQRVLVFCPVCRNKKKAWWPEIQAALDVHGIEWNGREAPRLKVSDLKPLVCYRKAHRRDSQTEAG